MKGAGEPASAVVGERLEIELEAKLDVAGLIGLAGELRVRRTRDGGVETAEPHAVECVDHLKTCVCQLDLAPFDTLIWPHLALVSPALADASF